MIPVQHLAAVLLASPLLSVVMIGLLIAVMAGLNLRGRKTVSQRRHRQYRAAAKRVIQQLSQLPGDAQRLNYLRKINPYVFEKLLLLAFERQGHPVKPNASYSGDGGLVGQVFIAGERYLIQAKRYGKAITPSHIQIFGALLLKERCKGFFIHTGRTGKLSRALLLAHPQVHLISGQQLLDFLAGKSLKFQPGKNNE